MVSNIQENSNEMGSQETIDLAYSKIERSYRSQNASGAWQAPKHVSYDLEKAVTG
jgi:type VI protein secretion system component Hcp